jgi:transcriptional regulator ATRX
LLDDGEEDDNGQTKGRHKIRKVIKDKHLAEETKEAAAEERDRRKRIEERQATYNKIFSIPEGKDSTCDQLVLDFDPKTKQILVEVNKKLVTKLKPHQVNMTVRCGNHGFEGGFCNNIFLFLFFYYECNVEIRYY